MNLNKLIFSFYFVEKGFPYFLKNCKKHLSCMLILFFVKNLYYMHILIWFFLFFFLSFFKGLTNIQLFLCTVRTSHINYYKNVCSQNSSSNAQLYRFAV